MNYSIEPTQFMASPLQADPGFTLSGLGKSFPSNPMENLSALNGALMDHTLNPGPQSLSAANHLNPLVGTPTYSTAELKKVSENFESIFMRMMFKEMRDSVQKSDLFGDNKTMGLFQSMYDDQLSTSLSDAGGIGIGKMIYQQLEKATGIQSKTIS